MWLLILYLATLLNSFISSNNFVWNLQSFLYRVIINNYLQRSSFNIAFPLFTSIICDRYLLRDDNYSSLYLSNSSSRFLNEHFLKTKLYRASVGHVTKMWANWRFVFISIMGVQLVYLLCITCISNIVGNKWTKERTE